MKDRLDAARKRRVGRQSLDEVVLIEIVGNAQVRDVDELVAIFQIIDHDDIIVPAIDQRTYKVTPNKPGAAGYDHHDA